MFARYCHIMIVLLLLTLAWQTLTQSQIVWAVISLLMLVCYGVTLLIHRRVLIHRWQDTGKWIGQMILLVIGLMAMTMLFFVVAQINSQNQFQYGVIPVIQEYLAWLFVLLSVSLGLFLLALLLRQVFGDNERSAMMPEYLNNMLLGAILIVVLAMVVIPLVAERGAAIMLMSILMAVLTVLFAGMMDLDPVFLPIYRQREVQVLMHIQRAIRSNLPIFNVLQCAALSETGRMANLLKSMSVQLQQGLDLSQAIAMNARGLGARQIRLLRTSDELGKLPQAIDRVLARSDSRPVRDVTESFPDWRYLMLNLLAASLVLAGLMIIVIPKMERILMEHDAALPWITWSMIRVSHWLFALDEGQTIPGFVLLQVPVCLVFAVGGMASRDGMVARWVEWVLWRLPLYCKVHRAQCWAQCCHQLADGLEAGLPLENTLNRVAGAMRHVVVTKRLSRWAKQLEQGQMIGDAARASAMPTEVCRLCTDQDLPRMMRYLGEHYALSAQHGLIWLRAVVAPVMVILIALPVAWICVALITPLSTMIMKVVYSSGAF
jgi:type II secretory pathway component PulF